MEMLASLVRRGGGAPVHGNVLFPVMYRVTSHFLEIIQNQFRIGSINHDSKIYSELILTNFDSAQNDYFNQFRTNIYFVMLA